jgi:acetyl esterase/lipase
MNYTLAGANSPPVPMQTDDISEVVNYITTNKSSLIVSDDIGFIGVSAGAHLSLLWSYANDTNNQVAMVCSIVGPVNFTDPEYYNSTFLTKSPFPSDIPIIPSNTEKRESINRNSP